MWLIYDPQARPNSLRALPLKSLRLRATRNTDRTGALVADLHGEVPVTIAEGTADDMAALLRRVIILASTLTPGASAVEVWRDGPHWRAEYVDATKQEAGAAKRGQGVASERLSLVPPE